MQKNKTNNSIKICFENLKKIIKKEKSFLKRTRLQTYIDTIISSIYMSKLINAVEVFKYFFREIVIKSDLKLSVTEKDKISTAAVKLMKKVEASHGEGFVKKVESDITILLSSELENQAPGTIAGTVLDDETDNGKENTGAISGRLMN